MCGEICRSHRSATFAAGVRWRRARAVGDRGTILVDGGQPPVLTYTGAPVPGRRNVPTADSTGLHELVRQFVAYLDGDDSDAPAPMTAAAARDVMRLIDAAYQSFASGEPVAVVASPALLT